MWPKRLTCLIYKFFDQFIENEIKTNTLRAVDHMDKNDLYFILSVVI